MLNVGLSVRRFLNYIELWFKYYERWVNFNRYYKLCFEFINWGFCDRIVGYCFGLWWYNYVICGCIGCFLLIDFSGICGSRIVDLVKIFFVFGRNELLIGRCVNWYLFCFNYLK